MTEHDVADMLNALIPHMIPVLTVVLFFVLIFNAGKYSSKIKEFIRKSDQ